MNKHISPKDIVARGQTAGIPLEPFGPIWDSAFFRFSRDSWQTSDLTTFAAGHVPYVATSNGFQSDAAVEVLLESQRQTGRDGPIKLLEVGSGSGVFAKMFLDRLRVVAPDVYDRTRYLATDYSQPLLDSQDTYEVFAGHPDVVTQLRLDANSDWPTMPQVQAFLDGADGFDGIFATYLLDSLPMDYLAIKGAQVWRKDARTVVSETSVNARGLDIDTLQSAVAGGADLSTHRAALPHLALQLKFREIDPSETPRADCLMPNDADRAISFIHSYGAIGFLETALEALKPGAAAIVSDFGSSDPSEPKQMVSVTVYGDTVACPVNFLQIDHVFGARAGVSVFAPSEGASLPTRVLTRDSNVDLGALVDDIYGAAREKRLDAPIEKAEALDRAGNFDQVRRLYMHALDLQPRNWKLINKVVRRLITAGEFQAAIDLADCALVINPISEETWGLRCVATRALGRAAEAREAAEAAVDLDPANVGKHTLLVQAQQACGQHREALTTIAQAFGIDRDGTQTAALQGLQSESIRAIVGDPAQRNRDQANRIRYLTDIWSL